IFHEKSARRAETAALASAGAALRSSRTWFRSTVRMNLLQTTLHWDTQSVPSYMNPKQIMIYDTTLRDGTQAEGISFSVHDKIRIAEKLDAFGVHYIEGGWPGSNPKDIAFFDAAKKRKWRHAKICAFGSTCRANAEPAADPQIALLLAAETPT